MTDLRKSFPLRECNERYSKLNIYITSLEEFCGQFMKAEQGEHFSLENVNLTEIKRRTGLSRGKQRKMKRDRFKRKQ